MIVSYLKREKPEFWKTIEEMIENNPEFTSVNMQKNLSMGGIVLSMRSKHHRKVNQLVQTECRDVRAKIKPMKFNEVLDRWIEFDKPEQDDKCVNTKPFIAEHYARSAERNHSNQNTARDE